MSSADVLVALAMLQAAPEPPHGTNLGDTLRTIALAAIILGVAGLLLVEFVWKRHLSRGTYRWLLLFGLAVAPAFALAGATGSMFEEMKEVEACNSCHVMNPFVDDMHDPASATLAARHFRTGAIPTKQCYSCHTGYGIFGTLEAKRDGLRHWLLYVTRRWPEPIAFRGTYPNEACLGCHAAVPAFQDVPSHAALGTDLQADRINCFTCHGLPHPSRPERAPEGARAVTYVPTDRAAE